MSIVLGPSSDHYCFDVMPCATCPPPVAAERDTVRTALNTVLHTDAAASMAALLNHITGEAEEAAVRDAVLDYLLGTAV